MSITLSSSSDPLSLYLSLLIIAFHNYLYSSFFPSTLSHSFTRTRTPSLKHIHFPLSLIHFLLRLLLPFFLLPSHVPFSLYLSPFLSPRPSISNASPNAFSPTLYFTQPPLITPSFSFIHFPSHFYSTLPFSLSQRSLKLTISLYYSYSI